MVLNLQTRTLSGGYRDTGVSNRGGARGRRSSLSPPNPNLYVRTNLATPQSHSSAPPASASLPMLPPLHSTISTTMPSSTGYVKQQQMQQRGSALGLNGSSIGSRRIVHTTPTPQEPPQQRHFFTTPRTSNVNVPGHATTSLEPSGIIASAGSGSLSGISSSDHGAMTTTDERNPPSTSMRGTAYDSIGDNNSGGNSSSVESYDEFADKVRSEMRRVSSDMLLDTSGRKTTMGGGNMSTSGRSPPLHVNVGSSSGGRQQWSRDSPRTVERNALLERTRVLEDELAQKDVDIISLHGERLRTEDVMDQCKRLEQLNGDLRLQLSDRDSQISELREQLRSMKDITDRTIASEKDGMEQTHKQDLERLEKEYEEALTKTVRENDDLQRLLSETENRAAEIRDEARNRDDEILELRDENDALRAENEAMRQLADVAENDVRMREVLIKELESDFEDAVNEKMRLETAIADKNENYKNLVEEKVQLDRDNAELRHELDSLMEEYDEMKQRMVLLNDVTDALECAVDEKQSALYAKDDAMNDLNALRDEMDGMQRALKTALAERETALAEHSELLREHTRMASTKESNVHMIETLTRQRDKMSDIIAKYQEEIRELEGEKTELKSQRDDLKEELICVL